MRRFARRSRSARRCAVASAIGLVAGLGLATGVAPAAAEPVTVRSPVKAAVASIDITSTTVDYDRAAGRLAVTVALRGRITPGRGEGPTYSVLLFGPRNVPGGTGQAVLSMVGVGFPAIGALVFNPVGTAVDQQVPVDVRYVGNRVEFRAQDDLLKNLPLRYLQVQTSLDRIFIPSNVDTTDAMYGRFIATPRPVARPARP